VQQEHRSHVKAALLLVPIAVTGIDVALWMAIWRGALAALAGAHAMAALLDGPILSAFP
jgi:hypothetical protein